ncbi:CIC11C00000003447 [Sungouiella intermedia]|nr:CIC11C00000003447 [[Candida] intermedia]
MYDLRLSLSLEFPIDESSVEPIMRKNKPTLTRIKRRTSWRHPPTVTQFDFTMVLLPKTTRNKLGKNVTEHENTHELELEIDTKEIFKGFDKIRDGSDTIRFEELVEVFLNNARCLNNRVTKLASK